MTVSVDAASNEMLAAGTIDPLAAATALVPALRARSAETEALGRLPDSTIADLENARLFDLLIPTMYGGLQCSLRTFMDTVVEIGRGDGSTAWVVALLSAGNWIATTLYPEHVVAEVSAGGNLRVGGVLTSQKVTARRVDGGYFIEEGLWRFNSGVAHAQWDVLGIPILNSDGEVIDRCAALIPTSQITLLNDWDTIGLRGSGSTSVAVKEVFVPDERTVLLSRALQEDYASTPRNGQLYRMPLFLFLCTKMAFPALGIAKAALELFVEKAPHRAIAHTFYTRQDEATITHLQAASASAKIDAAELLLRRSVDDLDASSTIAPRMTRELRARIWRDAGAASGLLWEAVDLLASASGGSFAHVGNPMNRLWRDLRIAGMHGGVCTTSSMEASGRVLFGKNPNSPFL